MTLQGHLGLTAAGGKTREFRRNLKQCKHVFLNVRALSIKQNISCGMHTGEGEDKLELLKIRMSEQHLYLLVLSEVRLEGSGVTTYADGYVLIFAGSGPQGGGGSASVPCGGRCLALCWEPV
jgi:hypothetical protein